MYLKEKERLKREQEEKDKLQREQEANEQKNKLLEFSNNDSTDRYYDDKYSKEQTINFDKFNRELTQDEIEEWRRLKKLPKWKKATMEMLHITEKEYDECALRVNLPIHNINNKKIDFYDTNYNSNSSYQNYYGIGRGPYTTRGINDYHNDIKMFPIYQKCETERGRVNKFHDVKVLNYNKVKSTNPLFYIYPANKYRQLYQK